MVWKLLRKNISPGQIAGYSLASLVGLTIVICAVKFYGDVSSAFKGEDSFLSKDYVIISKSVSMANTLGRGESTTFSDDDLDDIRRQPWVRDIGVFTAANFNVEARMDLGGRGMSTHLFLEAIPDRFLDIEPSEWKFDRPGSPDNVTAAQIEDIEIPVIMSRDYLTLYNFGFAASRGMPQLNEKLIGKVPVTLELAGHGRYDRYRARVVGFSSRLNTIAVPQDFLDWANERYAAENTIGPSRVIIEANTPGDPAIQKYLDRYGYEAAGDRTDNSRANYFLTVATTIVIAVGAIITILAFFILTLSIFLLLQKNKRKLHELMLLGYSPGQIAGSYCALVGIINLTVLIVAVILMLLSSDYWVTAFEAIGITSASPLTAILVGLAISAFVTGLNCLAIIRIVRRNFYAS